MKIVMGIDPGMGGAIATANGNELEVVKMPRTSKDLFNYFAKQRAEGECIAFLEKVNAFVGEGDEKKFGIIKMIEQNKSIKVCLEILEIPIIEIASTTWQSRLKFKRIKGEKKTARKRRYYEWAMEWAPKNKFLVPQGDSVCILACGLKLIKENDPLVTGNIHETIEELF